MIVWNVKTHVETGDCGYHGRNIKERKNHINSCIWVLWILWIVFAPWRSRHFGMMELFFHFVSLRFTSFHLVIAFVSLLAVTVKVHVFLEIYLLGCFVLVTVQVQRNVMLRLGCHKSTVMCAFSLFSLAVFQISICSIVTIVPGCSDVGWSAGQNFWFVSRAAVSKIGACSATVFKQTTLPYKTACMTPSHQSNVHVTHMSDGIPVCFANSLLEQLLTIGDRWEHPFS